MAQPRPPHPLPVLLGEKYGGLVDVMCSMEVNDEDILRAVSAHKALGCCAEVLRKSCKEGAPSYFHMSSPIQEIEEFWSHSWRAEPWKKIATLLVLKRGPAAAVIGTVGAIVAMSLFGAGMLPGYRKTALVGGTHLFGPYALFAGLLCSSLALAFWRPRTFVFLDQICINQTDLESKANGVLHMGAFLKKSKSMLVLWDPTFVQRLWCMFELAAFLKSHEDEKHKHRLSVRPIFLGPCTFAIAGSFCGTMFGCFCIPFDNLLYSFLIFAAVGAVASYSAAVLFRRYYRSIQAMEDELSVFQLERTQCLCCSLGHGPGPAFCDRQLVTECIRKWFGSTEGFEQCVRSSVSAALSEQLGNFSFPYFWVLGSTMPLVWGQMDAIAARLRSGSTQGALGMAILTLAWWLAVLPIQVRSGVALANYFRERQRNLCLDVLVNVMGLIAVEAIAAACMVLEAALFRAMDPVAAASTFAVLVIPAAALAYSRCCVVR